MNNAGLLADYDERFKAARLAFPAGDVPEVQVAALYRRVAQNHGCRPSDVMAAVEARRLEKVA